MKYLLYIYILLINILGFLLMYIDKQRAIKNKWRISETSLLSIAIIGGSIGMYLGMNKFRHKTKHNKFKIGIPLIIIFQLLLYSNQIFQ